MRAGTQSKNDQIGKEQNHEVQSGARQAIGAPHITQTYGKKTKRAPKSLNDGQNMLRPL